MRLTKSLRAVILRQFKSGERMLYLANLYGFSPERIEEVVRLQLIAQEVNGVESLGDVSRGTESQV